LLLSSPLFFSTSAATAVPLTVFLYTPLAAVPAVPRLGVPRVRLPVPC
jgi:hypothetical protein